MIKYKVWDPMGSDEEGASEILAQVPEEAAEMYMEDFANNNPLESAEYDLLVKDIVLDTLYNVRINIDWDPTFYGRIVD